MARRGHMQWSRLFEALAHTTVAMLAMLAMIAMLWHDCRYYL